MAPEPEIHTTHNQLTDRSDTDGRMANQHMSERPLISRRATNDAWNSFVAQHPAAHVLQTSQWGALKNRFDWRCDRTVLTAADGSIRAGALVLFRRLFYMYTAGLLRTNVSVAYVPKGPLVDWHDRYCTEALLQSLEMQCRRHNATVLKIEPDLPDTPAHRALLRSYGFQPSTQTVQPRSTLVLDITGTEDDVLGRMKSKWRYNIRLARRKDVTVREGTRADLAHFNELMQVTGDRKEFAIHSAAYYAMAFDLFVPDYAAFLIAEYAGQPLAALVVFALGDTAWYLWGASSNRERNRMPNHALQWAAIQWARRRGAARYDLWGIPDDVGKVAVGLAEQKPEGVPADELPLDLRKTPNDELWGVYRLKQGFGGNVVRFVGAWDKPLDPARYRLYTTGLRVRAQIPIFRTAVTNAVNTAHTFADGVRAVIQPDPTTSAAAIASEKLVAITTPAAWRAILADLPAPHVLQSWEWGVVKAQTGWHAERYAFYDNPSQQAEDGKDAARAAFQFLWRQPVAHLPLRIAYIPKGPLLDWSDETLVADVLDCVEQLARAKGCLLVKIDPDVRTDTPAGRRLQQRLRRRGWRFSAGQIQFQNTAFSELPPLEPVNDAGQDETDDPLLSAMKSKWRYNIRLAGRRGIRVRQGDTDDLHTFYSLYEETSQRDGFLIRPFPYYQTVWQTFLTAQSEAENPAGGALLLAEHDDEDAPVAGLFLLRYGACTWYMYGASSERRRRDMPNHLLQWEALQWARQQGCTRYDWWGAPTDLDDPDDPLQGVWRFKEGFGAAIQPHIGAWDWPTSPWLYDLYTQAMPTLLDAMRKIG